MNFLKKKFSPVISIITFFISNNIKQYLIISVISLLISLYLVEGYLTFNKRLVKQQILKEKLYEKQTKKKWDSRPIFKVYEDLKKKNNEVVVSVYPNFYLKKEYSIFPLSGISNSETIFCNENGYYSIYQSDRYGFNNPDENWDGNEIDYLLVGDSYTHGECVNRPDDIASVLRTLSKKFVLNLGYGGNGPLIKYATLREFLNSNVKKILWIYYEGNDLKDLVSEKEEKILNSYLENLTFTQNLKKKQNDVDDLKKKIIEIEKLRAQNQKLDNEKLKYKILKFLRLNKTKKIFTHKNQNVFEKNIFDEFKNILILTKNLAINNNSELYFVYLPEFDRYNKNYDDENYFLIKNIVNKLNISFIDIHKEVFEKEQNPLKLFPFELPGHYNVDGYKKITETIYKFTKD
jgi:hypothetical protein